MKTGTSYSADRGRPRSRLAFALRLVVSGALLFLLLSRVPVNEVLESLAGAFQKPLWLLGAAGLAGAGVALAVARWRTLIESTGEPAGFWPLFQAFLVGNFFNQFFPSTIGGDVARSWWMREHLGSMTRSLTVVAFDRLLGIAGICFVGLLAVIVRPDALIALPGLKVVTGVLLATLGGLWVVVHPNVTHVIRQALPDALAAR